MVRTSAAPARRAAPAATETAGDTYQGVFQQRCITKVCCKGIVPQSVPWTETSLLFVSTSSRAALSVPSACGPVGATHPRPLPPPASRALLAKPHLLRAATPVPAAQVTYAGWCSCHSVCSGRGCLAADCHMQCLDSFACALTHQPAGWLPRLCILSWL